MTFGDGFFYKLALLLKRRCYLCDERKSLIYGKIRRFLYPMGNHDGKWTCDECFLLGIFEENGTIYQKTICKWCGAYFFSVRHKNGRNSLFCSTVCALSYSNKNGYND